MAMNSPRGAAHTVASLRSFLAKMVGEVMVANDLVSLFKG
jgi:hypothetical protein